MISHHENWSDTTKLLFLPKFQLSMISKYIEDWFDVVAKYSYLENFMVLCLDSTYTYLSGPRECCYSMEKQNQVIEFSGSTNGESTNTMSFQLNLKHLGTLSIF